MKIRSLLTVTIKELKSMLTCRNCISQQLEKKIALRNMQWEDICVLQDFNILTKNAAKTSCLDSPLTHLRAILLKPHYATILK